MGALRRGLSVYCVLILNGNTDDLYALRENLMIMRK